MNGNDSRNAMLWREIERVLNDQGGLDVLEIRRKSNMLKQETPKILTALLYAKEKQGVLQKSEKPDDFAGNKKPLWSLRSRAPYHHNYHSNTFNHENQQNNNQSHYNYNHNHAQNMQHEHHNYRMKNDSNGHNGHSRRHHSNNYNEQSYYDHDDYYNKPAPRKERRPPQYRKKEEPPRAAKNGPQHRSQRAQRQKYHDHDQDHHQEQDNHHQKRKSPASWHCPICTFENSGSAAVCAMCQQSPRPSNLNLIPIATDDGMNGHHDINGNNNHNHTNNTNAISNAQVFAYNDASFYNPAIPTLPLQNVPQLQPVSAIQSLSTSSPVSPHSPAVLVPSPSALHSPPANGNNVNPFQFNNNHNSNNNNVSAMNGGYQMNHKVNSIGGRGRGRGRGFSKLGAAPIPAGYINPRRRTKLEAINEHEHKLNVDAADFVPSSHPHSHSHSHSQLPSPVSSSPTSPVVSVPGAHISTLIATPFIRAEKQDDSDDILKEYYAKRKGDWFFTGYLYHINIERVNTMIRKDASTETRNGSGGGCEAQMCPLGIFMPCKIPDYCLQHIEFPIQIVANCERQYKQYIDQQRQREENKEQDGDEDSDHKNNEQEKFVFDKEDRTVTLELIKQTTEQTEHRIHEEAFANFAKSNAFIWTKMNQLSPKADELQICNEENLQKRTYFVVPLKYEEDGLEIDYESIKIACLGALGKYNGVQWRKRRSRTCSLKGELVEIRTAKERKLCVSYGIHAERYKQIKDEKERRRAEKLDSERKQDMDDDDTRSIASFYSFANESVIERFEAMKASNAKILNPRSFKNKNKTVIVTMREDSFIPNVFDAQTRSKTMAQLRKLRSYELLEDAYPCGIRSNLWYSLKNIPSILFHLEKWFNLIDLQQFLAKSKTDEQPQFADADDQKSPYEEASSLHLDSCIDLSLLYHALHRAQSSTSTTYQIFNCLGGYILKFLATLYKFSTDPTCDHLGIERFVKEITRKTSVRHKLYSVACALNLESYAILHDFEWRKWNPPQFQDRTQQSLYDGSTHKNLLQGDDDPFLSAYLLQSVIGTFWSSIMNQNRKNPVSFAIDTTLQFLTHINILPVSPPYHVADEIRNLRRIQIPTDGDLDGFKVRIAGDDLEMNILLAISLQCVTTKCAQYAEKGITFERLELLGDAVLDMLVMWHMYSNIGDNKFCKQIANKQEKQRINWKEELSNMRHILVNDNYLGYLFLQNTSFIQCHHQDPKLHEQIAAEIAEYAEAISEKEYEGDLGEAQPLIEGMKTQKSPGGYSEDDCKERGVQKWQLQCTAPKILGKTFEAVLGAIFLGSNDRVFIATSPFNRKVWNLRYCVEYLLRFMMENERIWDKDFKWDQWIGKESVKTNVRCKASRIDIV